MSQLTAIEKEFIHEFVSDHWERILKCDQSGFRYQDAREARGVIIGLWFTSGFISADLKKELSLLRDISYRIIGDA